MQQKLQQRKSEGFTIIEVMIVLAIAGLIMLIVFLAVPALQRNSHNTSIKNDVAGVLGAMNEYTNNNNGAAPTGVGTNTVSTVVIGAASSNQATAKVGYIDGTTVTAPVAATGAVANNLADGKLKIYTKAQCNANGKDLVAGTSTRQYAVLYALEGGAKVCQAS
jgi:prepilin-type N-terminal cleavage/methylation domain-containing protein